MHSAESLVWSGFYSMGKAGPIKKIVRRKEFMIGFWGTFIAVLALPSAVLTFLGTHFSVGLTVSLILFALSLSAVVNRYRWKTRHLPVEDIVPDDIEVVSRTSLCCPCDLKLANQVGRLAQYYYGGTSISPVHYEPLRVKNPYILACLLGSRGDFLGYFDVIPLKESFATLFLQGRVTEKDMTHEDIFAPQEMVLCRHVYISGVAVCDPDTHTGRRNAHILVWALLKYIDYFYSEAKPFAFASAVTKDGEKLLRSFKLQVVNEADKRADGHTMYGLQLSHDEITKRLTCLVDWSLLCSLGWASNDQINSIVRQHRRGAIPRKKRHSLSA